MIITWINISYDVWWSISFNSLGQQFSLGFHFPPHSALLALQIGNVLLLKPKIFYITIRWFIIMFLYGFNQPLFLVKKGSIHKTSKFK